MDLLTPPTHSEELAAGILGNAILRTMDSPATDERPPNPHALNNIASSAWHASVERGKSHMIATSNCHSTRTVPTRPARAHTTAAGRRQSCAAAYRTSSSTDAPDRVVARCRASVATTPRAASGHTTATPSWPRAVEKFTNEKEPSVQCHRVNSTAAPIPAKPT